MPTVIRATDSTIFDFTEPDRRKNTKSFQLTVNGLRASTEYDVYLNGILSNFVIKPWGKDLGEKVLADSEGVGKFTVLSEFEPVGVSFFSSFTATRTNTTEEDLTSMDSSDPPGNFVPGILKIELKSPNHTAVVNYRSNSWLSPSFIAANPIPNDTEE